MNTLKRTSCIKKGEVIDPYAKTINIDSNLGINSIITSTSDNELKALIHIEKNKFEMDCEEEIEENQKACLESLSKINEKKNKQGFNPIMEINNLKWEQRNMIELIFPEKGGKSIYIFNPFFNKIERILLDTEEEDFPICFALHNKLPYCFCSGGKAKIDGEYAQ